MVTMIATAASQVKSVLEKQGWIVRRLQHSVAGLSLFHDIDRSGVFGRRPLILDVGAHVGETSLEYMQRWPNATIFAFEPVSANFSRLRDNVLNRPAIEPLHLAVGEELGEATIWLHGESSQENSLKATAATNAAGAEIVPVTTIDAFMTSRALSHVDLLKVDAEGFEVEILCGAQEMLATRRIGCVLLESTFDLNDQAHTPLPVLQTTLAPHGYRPVSIYDQNLFTNPVRSGFFNVLFVATEPVREARDEADGPGDPDR
jgi:FkbM family methyltransferase